MKIAALGRTHWLYDSIRACAAHGYKVVLIGTCPASPEYLVTEYDFDRLARELNALYFCDSAINQPKYAQMVNQSGAKVAISVNWLTLIGQTILDQFEYGVINAHPGDLPRFRGNACPNWAILADESKIALTLHLMTVELDAGPILLKQEFPLTSKTCIADCYRFLSENIPAMFVTVLDGLRDGSIVAEDQPTDPTLSLRCFPRLPRDSEIDWTCSADELARLVRASAEPFAGAYSFIGTERVIIWRAHSEQLLYPHLGTPGQVVSRRSRTGEVAVLTGSGVLVLEEIEIESSGRGRATDLIKSMRTRLGMDMTGELARLRRRVTELEHLVAELRRTQS